MSEPSYDPDHYRRLAADGVRAWNAWRREKPDEIPSLQGANLVGRNLRHVDLISANLSQANLTRADLRDADLRGAVMHGAVFHGADARNAQFTGAEPGDLQGADLSGADLRGASLRGANLHGADLSDANLMELDLTGVDLTDANLSQAKCNQANLHEASLSGCNLKAANLDNAILGPANLRGATLTDANLQGARLSGADLQSAYLYGACLCNAHALEANLSAAQLQGSDLRGARFSGADLSGADLFGSALGDADFSGATLNSCKVFGVSANWRTMLPERDQQTDLCVSHGGKYLSGEPWGEPPVTVDTLEVAQLVHLLLQNPKIRDIIDTRGLKAVLILGRFAPEQNAVLQTIRERLRALGYIPMTLELEESSWPARDLTEYISILAGLSRFVIADIGNPSSSPLELDAVFPDCAIPCVPIIQRDQEPLALFRDLEQYGPWVQDLVEYDTAEDLIEGFEEGVLTPALEAEDALFAIRMEAVARRRQQD